MGNTRIGNPAREKCHEKNSGRRTGWQLFYEPLTSTPVVGSLLSTCLPAGNTTSQNKENPHGKKRVSTKNRLATHQGQNDFLHKNETKNSCPFPWTPHTLQAVRTHAWRFLIDFVSAVTRQSPVLLYFGILNVDLICPVPSFSRNLA